MRNWIALAGLVFTAACGSSGSDIKCGDGTTLDNGECVPNGSGSNVTCGAGTQLDSTGTMCVPTPPGATGAPTITMITPNEAGAGGGVLFEIQGTGFAGDDVTALHVYFGDTTPGTGGDLGRCEALIGAATPTVITGEVPPFCNVSVVVTVQTNLGMATTNFKYDVLFAADGDGGGAFDQGGDLYVIDPFSSLSGDLGPLLDSDGNPYGLSGLAFGSDGTLYGVTPGDEGLAQLVTIDLSTESTTGPVVTVVGNLTDDAENYYFISDIKMNGTTLYGWAVMFGDGDTTALVSIDTTSGAVTQLGTFAANSYWYDSGLAVDSTGAMTVAPSGAGADADASFTATGELDSVDSTGTLTNVATLDYPIGAPINAATFINDQLVAVIDNGTYGATNQSGYTLYGEVLALIDPTASPIVGPLFQLPSALGAQSHIDALDIAPAATISIARMAPSIHWTKLPAVGAATAQVPGHKLSVQEKLGHVAK